MSKNTELCFVFIIYKYYSDIDIVIQDNLRLRPIARALERAGVCTNPLVIEKASVSTHI